MRNLKLRKDLVIADRLESKQNEDRCMHSILRKMTFHRKMVYEMVIEIYNQVTKQLDGILDDSF